MSTSQRFRIALLIAKREARLLREGSEPKAETERLGAEPAEPDGEAGAPKNECAPKNDSPPAEQAAREVSEPNPWRQAVDAALVAAGLDCLAPDAEAVPSLMALLARRVRIALDPAVSEEAQALIERGRESAPSVQVVEPEACTYPTCTGDAPADGGCCEKPFREHCQYPKACRASDPRGCNVFTCGGVVAQASALPAAQQPAVEPPDWEALPAAENSSGIQRLREAVEELMRHQLTGTREGMHALTRLVDAADAVCGDAALLDWLEGRLVDTIYLDDGEVIDVGGGRGRLGGLRAAIRAAMAAPTPQEPAQEPKPDVERCRCGFPAPCTRTVPVGFCRVTTQEKS